MSLIDRRAWEEQARPGTRSQQPLYGALEALESALGASSRPAESDRPVSPGPQDRKRASFQAEQAWRRLPDGGGSSFSSQRAVTTSRLQVARLQESLSDAATGLECALDIITSARMQEEAAEVRQQTRDLAELQREATALEDEAARMQKEEGRLQARLEVIQAEKARLRATKVASDLKDAHDSEVRPGSGSLAGDTKRSPRSKFDQATKQQDSANIAATLRLLNCLKDVALIHKQVVLPADSSMRTPYHDMVSQFLEEVEACQASDSPPGSANLVK